MCTRSSSHVRPSAAGAGRAAWAARRSGPSSSARGRAPRPSMSATCRAFAPCSPSARKRAPASALTTCWPGRCISAWTESQPEASGASGPGNGPSAVAPRHEDRGPPPRPQDDPEEDLRSGGIRPSRDVFLPPWSSPARPRPGRSSRPRRADAHLTPRRGEWLRPDPAAPPRGALFAGSIHRPVGARPSGAPRRLPPVGANGKPDHDRKAAGALGTDSRPDVDPVVRAPCQSRRARPARWATWSGRDMSTGPAAAGRNPPGGRVLL